MQLQERIVRPRLCHGPEPLDLPRPLSGGIERRQFDHSGFAPRIALPGRPQLLVGVEPLLALGLLALVHQRTPQMQGGLRILRRGRHRFPERGLRLFRAIE